MVPRGPFHAPCARRRRADRLRGVRRRHVARPAHAAARTPPVVVNPPTPNPGTPGPTVRTGPPTPPPPRISVTRILAFGDSLTEGRIALTATSLAVVPGSYPGTVEGAARQSLLRARSFPCRTKASGGEWARLTGAKRFPAVIRAHNPEVVILIEGANDLAALGRSGMSSAVRALETMAKEARFRGARVILAGLPPQRAPITLGSLVASSTPAYETWRVARPRSTSICSRRLPAAKPR